MSYEHLKWLFAARSKYEDYDALKAYFDQSGKIKRLILIRIILVPNMTKFYHSSLIDLSHIQNEEKLPHPPELNVQGSPG